jgi:hypothetical protein
LVAYLRLGLKYEMFRNLLVSRMRDRAVKPEGMKAVIDEIMAH